MARELIDARTRLKERRISNQRRRVIVRHRNLRRLRRRAIDRLRQVINGLPPVIDLLQPGRIQDRRAEDLTVQHISQRQQDVERLRPAIIQRRGLRDRDLHRDIMRTRGQRDRDLRRSVQQRSDQQRSDQQRSIQRRSDLRTLRRSDQISPRSSNCMLPLNIRCEWCH